MNHILDEYSHMEARKIPYACEFVESLDIGLINKRMPVILKITIEIYNYNDFDFRYWILEKNKRGWHWVGMLSGNGLWKAWHHKPIMGPANTNGKVFLQ